MCTTRTIIAVTISKPAITITLAGTRILHESSLTFAPTMDFMPRHGTPPRIAARRSSPLARGAWLISVTV